MSTSQICPKYYYEYFSPPTVAHFIMANVAKTNPPNEFIPKQLFWHNLLESGHHVTNVKALLTPVQLMDLFGRGTSNYLCNVFFWWMRCWFIILTCCWHSLIISILGVTCPTFVLQYHILTHIIQIISCQLRISFFFCQGCFGKIDPQMTFQNGTFHVVQFTHRKYTPSRLFQSNYLVAPYQWGMGSLLTYMFKLLSIVYTNNIDHWK